MSKRLIYYHIAAGSSLLSSKLLTDEGPVALTWPIVVVALVAAHVAGLVAIKALGSNPDTK